MGNHRPLHLGAVRAEQAIKLMKSSFSGSEEAITFQLSMSLKNGLAALMQRACGGRGLMSWPSLRPVTLQEQGICTSEFKGLEGVEDVDSQGLSAPPGLEFATSVITDSDCVARGTSSHETRKSKLTGKSCAE